MMGSDPVTIGYKRVNPRARDPKRATPGSSGFDLTACLEEEVVVDPGRVALVPTGLALAVPPGFEGQVRARSGLAVKHGVFVLNGPGTIDSDYRGPLGVVLANFGKDPFPVRDGDRVAQIVFSRLPEVELTEMDALPPTSRGEGGFGHTGLR